MLLLASLARAATLAVLYFENAGDAALDPLRVGLAQMLVSDLRGAPGVTVIERTQLQALLDELKLGHSGVIDPATASKVGKLLGADTLLIGSYFELMGTLRVDARMVKVETGEVLHAHGGNDQAAAFIAIERGIADAFRTALAGPAAKAVAPALPATVVAPDPDALKAAISFSEGLIALDRKDLPRASEAFHRAMAEDPGLEAARAELARLEL